MSEAAILTIAQYALRFGPAAAKALHDIFVKKDPTPADWDALFALVKPYGFYDPTYPVPVTS